ncbi:MAG: ribonuclease D [bacterium]|nr:ribonuclease D [bacterium]
MRTESPVQYRFVDNDPELRELTRLVRNANRVAVDTEADSLHHYFAKVCLIQLSVDDAHFIVDPLCGLDLDRFLHAIADKPLILHGADYDLRMLNASMGFRPERPIFDTMIAAQLLGYDQIGLAALVSSHFDVEMPKRRRKSNWARRPLSDSQLQYACDDTRFLVPLVDALQRELRAKKRTDWHEESCAAMVNAAYTNGNRDNGDPWRIKGAGLLGSREMLFLREFWQWRDAEARRIDRPAFMVMGNGPLMALAQWGATRTSPSLKGAPNLPRNCAGRRLDALKQAARRAHDTPKSEWPERRKARPVAKGEPDCRAEVTALREQCSLLAAELGIEPSVLAPKAAVVGVARAQATTQDDIIVAGPFLPWQARLIQPIAEDVLGD